MHEGQGGLRWPSAGVAVRCLALGLAWWTAAPARGFETNMALINRTNQVVTLTNLSPVPSLGQLFQAEQQFDRIIGPFIITSGRVTSIEWDSLAVGYGSAQAAWTNAIATYPDDPDEQRWGSRCWSSQYPHAYCNVGWTRRTRRIGDIWCGYLGGMKINISWGLTTTTGVYFSEGGVGTRIARVMVGTLGDYGTQQSINYYGPECETNFPGENAFTQALFKVDLTAYYKLALKLHLPDSTSDGDGDGIPDFADGYNRDPGCSNDDVSVTSRFGLWTLELPLQLDAAQTWVEVVYSASDPLGVTRDEGLYCAPTGALRVWHRRGQEPRDARSIKENGDYVPPGVYRARDLGFVSSTNRVRLYVEGVRPASDEPITARYATNTRDWCCLDAVNAYPVRMDLVPDVNHDRAIDADDLVLRDKQGPFRFWINDDRDQGDEAEGDSDLPGQTQRANGRDDVVNGRNDLVDFFPVWLNLKAMLDYRPRQQGVQYRLRQADEAVKMVLTDLTADKAGDYLIVEQEKYGPSLRQKACEAKAQQVTVEGVVLPENFLDGIRANERKGVILLEGTRKTTSPLVLEIHENGTRIGEVAMPLSLDGVEKMYRWVNLRNMTNPGPQPEPANNPDSLNNGTNLVFVHGFNVDEEGARSWNAEMFKRLYWSGSLAMYHAVSWFGNKSSGLDPLYQENVTNAFCTAPILKDYVAGLSGDVIVMAHSLGNMVASSAIADHNMTAAKYMMCNAAVAAEAYDAFAPQDNRMINTWWYDYSTRTWAAYWNERFAGTGDSRENMTWRDRFADVSFLTDLYHFYSSGDEVFSLDDAPSLLSGVFYVDWWFIIPISFNLEWGRHSWQKQELFKGTAYDHLIDLGTTRYAGWGFNSTVTGPDINGDYQVQPAYTVDQANMASDSMLRTNPVFTAYPAWLVGANALTTSQINEILAMGIPSITPAAGCEGIPAFDDNGVPQYDLDGSALRANAASWPNRSAPDDQHWLHSDLKSVAYPFVYPLFDTIATEGDLK